MIRTFFFDMGNVLVHFCHDRMCRQLAEVCGSDAATVKRFLFDEGRQADFERGQLTEGELQRAFEERFDRSLPLEDLRRAGSDIFSLNESIVPVVDALRSDGYRLVLLSNTSISHLNWVRDRWDILEHFDHLVTSYEAGGIKPEPAIFEAALGAADCEPEECFYTDDIAEYIVAARSYGIDAELYTDTPSLLDHLSRRGITVTLAD